MQSRRSTGCVPPSGDTPSFSHDQQDQLNLILGTLNEVRQMAKDERAERIRLTAEIVRLSETVSLLESRLSSAVKDTYTVSEVAKLAGRSEYTIRRWIKDEKLPSIRVKDTGPKGRLLIPREALESLLQHGLAENLPAIAIAAPQPIAA